MQAVTVVIPSVCTTAMTDARMRIAPRLHAAGDVVCIRVYTSAQGNRCLDQRLDRDVLHGFQQANDHVTTALDHPEDRGFLFGAGAASALALEPSPPSAPPFVYSRIWLALVTRSDRDLVTCHFVTSGGRRLLDDHAL